MKQPGDALRVLISKLKGLTVLKKSDSSRNDLKPTEEALRLIDDIENSREWLAIVPLARYLVAPDPLIADKAVIAIKKLLSNLDPVYLLQLEARVRGSQYQISKYPDNWDRLSPSELAKSISQEHQSIILGFASFHTSGYLREEAVRRLCDIRGGAELPYLLIRLCDWVPQVRVLAENSIAQRIVPDYVQQFIDCLGLVERVRLRVRADPDSRRKHLIDSIHALLLDEQNREILLSGLAHKNYLVRRICLQLIVSAGSFSVEDVLAYLMRDRDCINRRSALLLCDTLSQPAKIKTLALLVQDPSASIRRAAYGALCDADCANAQKYLETALLDRSGIVRESARWRMMQLCSGFDARAYYLVYLTENPNTKLLAAAIAGLGEVGKTEDVVKILPFVDCDRNAVQESALWSLARINASDFEPLFMRYLASKRPRLSNTARMALLQKQCVLDGEALWELFAATGCWHVRRNVLTLINHLEKWDRISFLMLVSTVSDDAAWNIAKSDIEAWVKRYRTTWSYTRASSKQSERFGKGLSSASPLLAVQTVEFLKYINQALK